jgi:DNA-directed RNA polymerase specialized sigma24 family protein
MSENVAQLEAWTPTMLVQETMIRAWRNLDRFVKA